MSLKPSGAPQAHAGKDNDKDKELDNRLDQERLMQNLLAHLRVHEELLLQRFGALIDQKFRDHFGSLERHLGVAGVARVVGSPSPRSLSEALTPRQLEKDQMPTMRLATSPSAPLRGDSHACPPEPDLQMPAEATPAIAVMTSSTTSVSERSVKFQRNDRITVPPATLAMQEAAARNSKLSRGSEYCMTFENSENSVRKVNDNSLHGLDSPNPRWTIASQAPRSDARKSLYRTDGLELAKGWFKEKHQAARFFEDDFDPTASQMRLLSPRELKMRSFMQGTKLLWVTGGVLLTHAVCLWLQAQWTLQIGLDRVYGRPADMNWQGAFLLSVNAFFLVLYIIEMLLRAYVQKKNYFLGPERGWNLIACALTLLDIIGLFIQAGMSPLERPAIGFIIGQCARSVRFLRIFQVIGSLQHELFHEVRLIILSIYGSFPAFLWAFLLVFLMMFVAGILMLQGVMYYLWEVDVDMRNVISVTSVEGSGGGTSTTAEGSLSNPEIVRRLEKYYGSVLQTLITLFQAISGGMDWDDSMLPLYETAWSYKIWFTLFIALYTCWILNVLTGVFVNVAMRRWQVDSDTAVQLELRRNETYVKAIKGVFNDLDQDDSGTISLQELEDHLKNPRVQAYFKNLELDVSEARGLFVLLDTEERNEVDIEEFCVGCMRLKGTAKSIDVATLLYENKKVMLKICNSTQFMEDSFRDLFQVLDVIDKRSFQTESSTV